MTQRSDTPRAPNATSTARHNGWTLAKQAAFLRQLSATHSVSEAAKSVGMSRQSAYRLRSKLKGKPFDLAWEVAFHHSYDVLAHAALERALNGVEVPVYYQGEQVGHYRRFDERLTVALLNKMTHGGNPVFGRIANSAEKHARDFEALLGQLERGEDVPTGALSVTDPGELEMVKGGAGASGAMGAGGAFSGSLPCPESWSDDEIMTALQEFEEDGEK